uniref:Uncharacterized protein n=1 Tax=Kalanchoe fedtschenkoi TaxID=63787 RepID=A0A7N0U5W1_KALFE
MRLVDFHQHLENPSFQGGKTRERGAQGSCGYANGYHMRSKDQADLLSHRPSHQPIRLSMHDNVLIVDSCGSQVPQRKHIQNSCIFYAVVARVEHQSVNRTELTEF